MSQEGGGGGGPDDTCTKTDIPIRELIQERKPQLQLMDATDPISSNFEFYEKVLDAILLENYGSDVK